MMWRVLKKSFDNLVNQDQSLIYKSTPPPPHFKKKEKFNKMAETTSLNLKKIPELIKPLDRNFHIKRRKYD